MRPYRQNPRTPAPFPPRALWRRPSLLSEILFAVLFIVFWRQLTMPLSTHSSVQPFPMPRLDPAGDAQDTLTLLLPVATDTPEALRQWMRPSSHTRSAICAWDNTESGGAPEVIVVVIEMSVKQGGTPRMPTARQVAAEFPNMTMTESDETLRAAGTDWRVWRFSNFALDCVRRLILVAPLSAAPGGFDAMDVYVKAALAAAPRRTPYFVLLADFIVPIRGETKGFLQQLLRPLRRNDGRVAAVQCTLITQRNQSEDSMTDIVQRGANGIPLATYVALDKGILMSYGTNWNVSTSAIFFGRRLGGYAALDERVCRWEEPIDAVSPHCGAFNRDAYDAFGGFKVPFPPSSEGTRGGMLLRDETLPDDPENSNVFLQATGNTDNFPALWPDAVQSDELGGWLFALRLHEVRPDWQLWSSTATAVVWTTPVGRLAALRGGVLREGHHASNVDAMARYFAPSYVLTGFLAQRWAEVAGVVIQSRAGLRRVDWGNATARMTRRGASLSVELRVLANYGIVRCSGMMLEAAHYFVPLLQRHVVGFWGYRCLWCPGLPSAALDALQRTQVGVNRWGNLAAWRRRPEGFEKYLNQEELAAATSIRTAKRSEVSTVMLPHVVMLHNAPRFIKYVPMRRPLSEYTVARVLSENTRLEGSDVELINTFLDELWVTCDFFRIVYVRSGVRPELIRVLPEAVDVYNLNPDLYPPFEGSIETGMTSGHKESKRIWTNRPELLLDNVSSEAIRRFRFISIFKWEPRKGWDVLLKAYWMGFGPGTPLHDHVSLHIKTHFSAVFAEGMLHQNMEEKLTHWALHEAHLPGFKSMRQFPPIFVTSTRFASNEMIYRMYRSGDAFVLPTRGEGWGMPTMEAMTMGLPVITTNWSGSTAFAWRNNSFLIPVDGLEELPLESRYKHIPGRKWAIPSVEETARLMEYVVRHPDHAKAVGQRARRDILERFSEEIVEDILDNRLSEIAEKVIKHRQERSLWTKTMLRY